MQPDNKNPNHTSPDNNDPQPPQQPDWQRWVLIGGLTFFFLWLLSVTGSGLFGDTTEGIELPYSVVRDHITDIRSIEIETTGLVAQGTFRGSVVIDGVGVTNFTTALPPGTAEELNTLLQENNPSALLEGVAPPEIPVLLQAFITFLPLLLIMGFFLWMTRRAQGQMNGVFGFGRSQAREYNPDLPRVTFDDVAGQDSAKGDLVEVVDFLRDPDKYISLGARIPRGVLLVGPPGTGKTLMARAVAGEANVAFYSIAASEFVEMFVGVGASRVRDLFNKAKENSPSIVFIDEIDAVGRQRGAGLGGGNDEREQTLNQLLAEMDGFDQSATVIVMAATNRPDVLDPALMRPGRFDRQVTVDLPDRKGRWEILKIHTRGKPLADNVDLESLAGATVGFSGADIANLANEGALKAARDNKRRIEQSDFSFAFERIILGNERPPLSNLEERRVVAYHEAGHAVVSAFTPLSNPVLKVTITPRGQALGITAYAPDEDIRNISRKRIEAYLDGLLGGRVSEEIVFGDITTGASNDLQRVTSLARNMVAQYGMTDAIGPMNFGDDESQPFLGYSLSQGRKYSEETAAKIDAETRRIVETAYKRTKSLLAEHREDLEKVAQALLEREVLERDEFLEILGLQDKRTVEAAELLDKMKDGIPPVPLEAGPNPHQEPEKAESKPLATPADRQPGQSTGGQPRNVEAPSARKPHPSAHAPSEPSKREAPNQTRPSAPPKPNEAKRNVPVAHPLFDSLFGSKNSDGHQNNHDHNNEENGSSDNKDD